MRPRQARYEAALPGDLERQSEAFSEHYDHRRTLHSPGHG